MDTTREALSAVSRTWAAPATHSNDRRGAGATPMPVQLALAAGNNTLASATTIAPPLANDTTDTTGTNATRDPGEIGGGPVGAPCNFPLSREHT